MATRIEALETPAVLIDLDQVEANLARAQAEADRLGLKLRPHIKTHKLPRFAKRQVELGAVGITVQKLGEAEVMADAGLTDLFLPYNILGPSKLARLRALNARVKLAVTADSPDTIAGYAAAFTADAPLTVLVECDTGMGRCGVQTPAQALALARQIVLAPGLSFGGLMTYPAAGKREAAEAWLAETKAMLAQGGFACPVISSGGTPDLWKRSRRQRRHRVSAGHLHLQRPHAGKIRRRRLGRLRAHGFGDRRQPTHGHSGDHRRRQQDAVERCAGARRLRPDRRLRRRASSRGSRKSTG